MTPRTEARERWTIFRCEDYGDPPVFVRCGRGQPGANEACDCQAVEVVPAVDLEQALDALEQLTAAVERNAGNFVMKMSWPARLDAARARAFLRAARRLDGVDGLDEADIEELRNQKRRAHAAMKPRARRARGA